MYCSFSLENNCWKLQSIEINNRNEKEIILCICSHERHNLLRRFWAFMISLLIKIDR